MPAPTEYPDWAESGSTTDPGPTLQGSGWTPGQRPGAQHFNWWMRLVGRWVRWFDSIGLRGPGVPVVDNRLVRFFGTNGIDVDAAPVAIDDNGDVTGTRDIALRNGAASGTVTSTGGFVRASPPTLKPAIGLASFTSEDPITQSFTSGVLVSIGTTDLTQDMVASVPLPIGAVLSGFEIVMQAFTNTTVTFGKTTNGYNVVTPEFNVPTPLASQLVTSVMGHKTVVLSFTPETVTADAAYSVHLGTGVFAVQAARPVYTMPNVG